MRPPMVRRASVVGGLPFVAACAALIVLPAARSAEVPVLRAGGVASMAGTHVRCKAADDSVRCTRARGLTASIAQTGVVHVTPGTASLVSAVKPRTLHNNDGFEVSGTHASIYCHVYIAGRATMDCALESAPYGVPNSHGFDISDSSVTVFRFDQSGVRHNVKTIPQP